ncbi:nitric oxide synthase oxygenase [Saccharothrix coeruleofusca]|uniref:Nitric oxide synthase oxygenase n=1 Tax=Saccharothrix coeruleofusca TaxID=33919 RepID=A0A918EBL4_9PSEU|nr:nitric oxide synthase oxygenase [Saccharothrix coeruleofusca]MBP2334312.1 nitric-oxide synthase [Saccharothrix coeruleofusca]GGP41918.1 nitric oxide synthase oxygenase [Saccharothrix coeruleofusca]
MAPVPLCPAEAIPLRAEPFVDIAEAEDFIRLHHAEHPEAGPVEDRLARVRAEIAATGTYRHTPEELTFGARVAWRNSARCIGRLYWRSLKVRDLRDLRDPKEIADECVEHLRLATNGGKIRPVITVFAPDEPGAKGPRIHNEQLIRYAGYVGADGGVLGDRRNAELTAEAVARGWRPPPKRGPFDVLPLIVSRAGYDTTMVELPRDAVLEVTLRHPELPWLADLGLRWHAVPAISNMRLRIGGVDYPAAPFNGWYMGTEIGARNFADTDRYDLLPYLARRMRLDTSSVRTLWKDRVLVELNRAVLYSFAADGVTITDHHTESDRFLTHVQREEAAGRSCPADWSWIVPPISGGATSVFHRYYSKEELLPNFFPAGTTGVCPMIN